MQKKFIKIILTFFIVLLFILNIKVMAIDDLISSNSNDTNENVSNNSQIQNEIDNSTDNELHEDAISSTSNDTNTTKNNSSYVASSYSAQPMTSYSTVATIPEANLSLNNILNAILIAIGVIIILLAIAILIRLK